MLSNQAISQLPVMQRLLLSVAVDNWGCWIWQKSRNRDGYGLVGVKGTARHAHRVMAEHLYGPLKTKQYVCHSCDEPSCVNPAHLWVGDQQQNMNDMTRKGRGTIKLNAEQVRAIRSLAAAGKQHKDIAPLFGVCPASVSCAVRGATWSHV